MNKGTRELALSISTLVISIIMLLGCVGFSAWGFGVGFGYYGRGDWGYIVFSLVLMLLRLVIIVLSLVSGICGIVWFVLYIAGVKTAHQATLLLIVLISTIVLTVLYIILTVLGFTMMILVAALWKYPFYSSFIGSLFAAIFFIFASVIIFLTRRFCHGSPSIGK